MCLHKIEILAIMLKKCCTSLLQANPEKSGFEIPVLYLELGGAPAEGQAPARRGEGAGHELTLWLTPRDTRGSGHAPY